MNLPNKLSIARVCCIPVITDDAGVAAVMGIGVSCDHAENPNVEICFVDL